MSGQPRVPRSAEVITNGDFWNERYCRLGAISLIPSLLSLATYMHQRVGRAFLFTATDWLVFP